MGIVYLSQVLMTSLDVWVAHSRSVRDQLPATTARDATPEVARAAERRRPARFGIVSARARRYLDPVMLA